MMQEPQIILDDDDVIPFLFPMQEDEQRQRKTDEETRPESKAKPEKPETISPEVVVQDSDSDNDSVNNFSILKLSSRVKANHSLTQVIGNVLEPIKTCKQVCDEVSHLCYVSNKKKAFVNDSWINDIHQELKQFERNCVWELLPRPKHTNVIGTRLVA